MDKELYIILSNILDTYPLRAPKDKENPVIVYTQKNNFFTNSLSCAEQTDYLYQVDLYTDTYDDLKTYTSQIVYDLLNSNLTVLIYDTSDSYEDDSKSFRCTINLKIYK